ncbi:MAG: IspD/TarI family cytidylyltransferase [Candidatus Acidulodesulfobacterium sp.]
MKIYAVLLAAGIGSRTGFSMPKQLIKIKNKEIILHSLDIFLNSKINFDAIIIAVPPRQIYDFNWNAFFGKNLSEEKNKKIKIITGGKSRQESVYNAVKYMENTYIKADKSEESLKNTAGNDIGNAIVFIHDSARPFVTDNELSILLDKTAEYGAAFLCSGVTETIKEINAGKDKIAETAANKADAVKLKTLLRDGLISAKTPQTFKFDIIKKAVYKAAEENFISTDDVSLVENLGLPVFPVKSTDLNIKITSSLDIEIAEMFLKKFHA